MVSFRAYMRLAGLTLPHSGPLVWRSNAALRSSNRSYVLSCDPRRGLEAIFFKWLKQAPRFAEYLKGLEPIVLFGIPQPTLTERWLVVRSSFRLH